MTEGAQITLHASCVALQNADGDWRAALITGPAGAGKSSLALDLISRGATLVADDRTCLRRAGGSVIAACPRGIGLIRAPVRGDAPVALIVDLDATEPDRLPRPRRADLLGLSLPRILCAASLWPAPAAAIHLLLRGAGAPEPT